MAATVAGCSHGGFPPSQEIEVGVVSDVPEAPLTLACTAENDRGQWVFSAPGKILVSVTSEPLRITCKVPATDGAGSTLAPPAETLYPSTGQRNAGVGVTFTLGLASVMRGFSAVVVAPLGAAVGSVAEAGSLRYPSKVTLHVVRADSPSAPR